MESNQSSQQSSQQSSKQSSQELPSSLNLLQSLYSEFSDINTLSKQLLIKRIEQKIIRDLEILQYSMSKKNTEISRWIYK